MSSQELAELAIARSWLAQWFDPLPIPELRDAASGEPLLLVTDHYRVLDADALHAALAAQHDVSGDAKDGWHRDSDAGGGPVRSLAAINPGRAADRIEVFYRAQKLADEVPGSKAWRPGRLNTLPAKSPIRAARPRALARSQECRPRPRSIPSRWRPWWSRQCAATTRTGPTNPFRRWPARCHARLWRRLRGWSASRALFAVTRLAKSRWRSSRTGRRFPMISPGRLWA